MKLRWLVLAALAVIFLLAVSAPRAGAASAVPDTSPAGAWFYPEAPNGGLAPSLQLRYQIVGTRLFVDYLARSVYDETIPAVLVYSKMCGPTFGCSWTPRTIGLGQTLNLNVSEYRDLPAASYTWCVQISGWGPTCHSWSVEAS